MFFPVDLRIVNPTTGHSLRVPNANQDDPMTSIYNPPPRTTGASSNPGVDRGNDVRRRNDVRTPTVNAHAAKPQDTFAGSARPPDYHGALRELNDERMKELETFDKKLRKKVGWKAAKGAAGGTIIGSAIFGGVVGHLTTTTAVSGTLFAKAGAALIAAHFWPVAVLIGCIVIGAGVGMLFKRAKLRRLAQRDMLKDRVSIKGLRDGLREKQKTSGLSPEEEQVMLSVPKS
jgi:hypothetical protein